MTPRMTAQERCLVTDWDTVGSLTVTEMHVVMDRTKGVCEKTNQDGLIIAFKICHLLEWNLF